MNNFWSLIRSELSCPKAYNILHCRSTSSEQLLLIVLPNNKIFVFLEYQGIRHKHQCYVELCSQWLIYTVGFLLESKKTTKWVLDQA